MIGSANRRSGRIGSIGTRAIAGFTLIEILIVGALISLFAGLAIFSVQAMYDSNKRKAMFDETRTLSIALGMAEQDLGFFPRISMLGLPLTLVTFNSAGTQQVRPGFDTYGYNASTDGVSGIVANWRPPYTQVSEVRRSYTAGIKLLVKVRFMEPGNLAFPKNTALGADISLVDWPADVWGHPYVVYLIKTDSALVNPLNNPIGLRVIDRPGENPDYMAAVVSYGPNGVPGGTDEKEDQVTAFDPAYVNYKNNVLIPASMFVVGDLANAGNLYTPDGQPIFTMRSGNPAVNGAASLHDPAFQNALAGSINSLTVNNKQIGMKDPGSDDIWYAF